MSDSPKYKVGDRVYVIIDGRLCSGVVSDVNRNRFLGIIPYWNYGVSGYEGVSSSFSSFYVNRTFLGLDPESEGYIGPRV